MRSKKFIKLTAPDGEPVWIAAQWVMRVQAPQPNLYPPEVKTLLTIGEAKQAVRETPKEVLGLLEMAGEVA